MYVDWRLLVTTGEGRNRDEEGTGWAWPSTSKTEIHEEDGMRRGLRNALGSCGSSGMVIHNRWLPQGYWCGFMSTKFQTVDVLCENLWASTATYSVEFFSLDSGSLKPERMGYIEAGVAVEFAWKKENGRGSEKKEDGPKGSQGGPGIIIGTECYALLKLIFCLCRDPRYVVWNSGNSGKILKYRRV
jgi:hypothetical protein